MIELKITQNNSIDILNITKNNNILFRDKFSIFKFYNLFDKVINQKDDKIKIEIQNKKVNNKNTYLINLIDFSYTIDNLKFKKNTLIYNYIENKINSEPFNDLDKINQLLNDTFISILDKYNFKYSYEINNDLFKLLISNFDIDFKIDDDDIYNKIIFLLDDLINSKLNTTFIIFYDSNLIDISCDKYENVYCFDCSLMKNIDEYNLIFSNYFNNFNFDILYDCIIKKWPIEYNDELLYKSINYYFQNCYIVDSFKTDNIYLIILTKIINELYGFKQECIVNSIVLNNNIKSFLTS